MLISLYQMSVHSVTHVQRTVKLLACQLFATLCGILLTLIPWIRSALMGYTNILLAIGSIGALGTILCLTFSKRKTIPGVIGFTLFEIMTLIGICLHYPETVVVSAVLATSAVCVTLSVYAMTTTSDHTNLMPTLLSILTGLIVMGFLNQFIRSWFLFRIELYLGTIAFMVYLIVDVQMYIRNKVSDGTVSDDLWIDAALNIYLDVINIFVRILEIINQAQKDKDNK